MESKPLRIHPAAEREYLAALAWYRERSRTAAKRFAAAVREAIEKIGESPQRWPFYIGDFRKYALHQFPFSILYQELLTEVLVVAIAHGHRRPDYWKGRV